MHVACIRTHLISSASAVSLVSRPEDRTRLLSSSLGSFSGPPSSPSLFAGRGLGTRLPQQLLEQHVLLAFSYVLGLLNLCCICSAVSTACRERCHVYVSL